MLLFVCLGYWSIPTSIYASDTVQFAGFALAGDASESEKAFPVTMRLLQEKTPQGRPVLEEALWKQVQESKELPFRVNKGLSDGSNPGESVSIAFVLDWENIAHEKMSDSTRLIIDLHGQVLVFDFDSRKVIGSYPVAVQLLHTIEGPSYPGLETSLVRSLYLGDSGLSIFQKFSERLPKIKIEPSTGNYIRVVSVAFEDKALKTLAQYGQEPAILQGRVADSFGKRLSENHHIAYVPFSKGMAVGAKMSARFANGNVYQLKLPEPDYRVHLTVRGFKKVLADQTAVESAWVYGSYLNVAIKDFSDEETYLDAPFKYGAVKKVVAGNKQIDDWSSFQESLFTLIDQVTLQTVDPDSRWVEKWSNGRPTLKQLKGLQRIMERSR